MTQNDLDILDTIGTSDYFTGELSDSGTVPRNEYAESSRFTSLADIDIPSHMVPPNPDDSDGWCHILSCCTSVRLTACVYLSLAVSGAPFVPIWQSNKHQTPSRKAQATL